MSAAVCFANRCVRLLATEGTNKSDLECVQFIRNCQGLGFSLREVEQLIRLHSGLSTAQGAVVMKSSGVGEIIELALERLTVIDEKITTLQSMRVELVALVDAVKNTSPAICPASRRKPANAKTSNSA